MHNNHTGKKGFTTTRQLSLFDTPRERIGETLNRTCHTLGIKPPPRLIPYFRSKN